MALGNTHLLTIPVDDRNAVTSQLQKICSFDYVDFQQLKMVPKCQKEKFQILQDSGGGQCHQFDYFMTKYGIFSSLLIEYEKKS